MSNNDKKPDWRFRPEKETTDIYDIHDAILREPPEPKEGLEKPPWWLWVVSVLLIFWAGFYIGRYTGDFGPYVHQLQKKDITVPSEPTGKEPVEAEISGSEVYGNVCAACHQAGGTGVPGAFPPLADSRWVTGDPEIPVKIVLHGLEGPIEVRGETYDAVMPPWGDKLSDSEVSAVLNYVRSSWGNSAPEISAELVKKVREKTSGRNTPWKVGELKNSEE